MRLIDGEAVLKWLGEKVIKSKYGKEAQAFADVMTEIQKDQFDIPSNQGEARLREALERISRYPKGEALVYVSEIKGIARDALSSHTEDTGLGRRKCAVCNGTGVDPVGCVECRPCDGTGITDGAAQ